MVLGSSKEMLAGGLEGMLNVRDFLSGALLFRHCCHRSSDLERGMDVAILAFVASLWSRRASLSLLETFRSFEVTHGVVNLDPPALLFEKTMNNF